jgi:hypothetical protein
LSGERVPLTIEVLQALLASPKPRENLKAIEAAALMHAAAAPLVPALTAFLASEAYVPVEQREYSFSGHAILAEDAMRTIEAIGVAPARDELRKLLGERRVVMMPEASYDQGAYIGDYSSTTFSPAGLAARLVPIDAGNAFALLGELAENAVHDAAEIGQPARRALRQIADLAVKADPADREAFTATIDRLAPLPQSESPTTHLGFDLRDLARHCRKVLGRT